MNKIKASTIQKHHKRIGKGVEGANQRNSTGKKGGGPGGIQYEKESKEGEKNSTAVRATPSHSKSYYSVYKPRWQKPKKISRTMKDRKGRP